MATYNIIAAGGNFSADATWGGGGHPVAGDTANLNGLTGTLTVDADAACAVLDCTGSAGTLAFGNYKITVTGGVTLGGTITAGTGGLVLTGAQTLTSGGITFPGYLKFSAAATFVLSGNWVNTGSFTVDTGAAVLNKTASETLTVNGSVTLTTRLTGTASVILGGTGTLNTGGACCGIAVDINTSGSITLSTVDFYTGGSLSYTTGTVVSTATLLRSAYYNFTLTLPGVTLAAGSIIHLSEATLTLGAALVTLGKFQLGTATFAGAYNVTAARMEFLSDNKTLTLTAGTTWTLTTSIAVTWYYTSSYACHIKSSVASSPVYLVYQGTYANCKLCAAYFTDVDASGSTDTLINMWGGTLTRTVNIVNCNAGSWTDPGAATVLAGNDYYYRAVLQTAALPAAKVVEPSGTLLKRSIVKTPNGQAAGGTRSCWTGVEAG
jgi:hypothetical protein